METEALIVINYILEEKPMTTHDTLGKGNEGGTRIKISMNMVKADLST